MESLKCIAKTNTATVTLRWHDMKLDAATVDYGNQTFDFTIDMFEGVADVAAFGSTASETGLVCCWTDALEQLGEVLENQGVEIAL